MNNLYATKEIKIFLAIIVDTKKKTNFNMYRAIPQIRSVFRN